MSPRKLTEDDKQEILQLYRNSEATTSTLADRYEVSSSTISRFLKNKLSSVEYEDLIQQKRLARTPRGEKTTAKKEKKPEKTTKIKKTSKKTKSAPKTEPVAIEADEIAETVAENELSELTIEEPKTESKPAIKRRRRRSSANLESESEQLEIVAVETAAIEETPTSIVAETEIKEELSEAVTAEEEKPAKLIIDRKTKDTDSTKTSKSNSLILKSERVDIDDDDDDDDDDEVDLITLKEMLGEDLEDINDEEDEEDWDDDDDVSSTYSRSKSNFDDVQILPLSQATFPRTCYLVIDRSAELIVKPLADFADLGEIPQEEVRQNTLPVFDNHNIAKRFSHRRERVIKVPDGRMLQKTSRHLQDKGITRLLIDGQIYSLST